MYYKTLFVIALLFISNSYTVPNSKKHLLSSEIDKAEFRISLDINKTTQENKIIQPSWTLVLQQCGDLTTICCCGDGNSYSCSLPGSYFTCYPGGIFDCLPEYGQCEPNPANCSQCCPRGISC